jgi:hypothetical protein
VATVDSGSSSHRDKTGLWAGADCADRHHVVFAGNQQKVRLCTQLAVGRRFAECGFWLLVARDSSARTSCAS